LLTIGSVSWPRIALALMSNATSICAMPRRGGGIEQVDGLILQAARRLRRLGANVAAVVGRRSVRRC
jgi:hypothetical protein